MCEMCQIGEDHLESMLSKTITTLKSRINLHMLKSISSIQLRWKDDRYVGGCRGLFDGACGNNMKRATKCPSNYVVGLAKKRFWLPLLGVENALELVAFYLRRFSAMQV